MDNALEHTGQWWVCGKEDERLPGVLTLSPEKGPRLRVMGQFASVQGGEGTPIEIVHGNTPACNRITLCDCSVQERGAQLEHEKWTVYGSDLAVLGRHYASKDAIRFFEVNVSYSTLVDWVDSPVYDYEDTVPRGKDSDKILLKPAIAMELCHLVLQRYE